MVFTSFHCHRFVWVIPILDEFVHAMENQRQTRVIPPSFKIELPENAERKMKSQKNYEVSVVVCRKHLTDQ